jgi:GNAT superfamily N-acetyltransferase
MSARLKIEIAYAQESLRAVRAEVDPLLLAHWQELAHFKDIPLKPRWDAYERLSDSGQLLAFTVRDRGALVGYAAYLVTHSMHYGILQAQQDVIYLDPEYRRGRIGLHLIRYSEGVLRQQGVELIYQHVKLAHPQLGRLLEHTGYTLMDQIWVKRLGEPHA